jgi:hypothetical protein
MNLQQVLKSSFSFLLLLVLATTAFAQEKEVSGAVTDETTGTPGEGQHGQRYNRCKRCIQAKRC